MSILIINGPNLNLLGIRESTIYGKDSLASINEQLGIMAIKNKLELGFYQSNIEGEIVTRIQHCLSDDTKFIIINPGAYAHTSIAIRDAILAINIPCIEVHVSNIYAREDFRKNSYISDIAIGIISGLGTKGYILALEFAIEYLNKKGV